MFILTIWEVIYTMGYPEDRGQTYRNLHIWLDSSENLQENLLISLSTVFKISLKNINI